MGGGNFALTCVPSLMDDPIQHQRYVITFAALPFSVATGRLGGYRSMCRVLRQKHRMIVPHETVRLLLKQLDPVSCQQPTSTSASAQDVQQPRTKRHMAHRWLRQTAAIRHID